MHHHEDQILWSRPHKKRPYFTLITSFNLGSLFLVLVHQSMVLGRSKGPCDVFDPWVRWERGQVGLRIRPAALAAASGNLGTWKSGNLPRGPKSSP